MDSNKIIIIMGVSGTGKSTIGKLLSNKMDIPFFDGDDYHPDANREKMASGRPLNDEDRRGWLAAINSLAQQEQELKGAIIACSALKEKYRNQIESGVAQIHFIHLEGSFELILARLKARKGHFMPPELLRSQFDALEAPKEAINISIELKPEEIVSQIYSIIA